MSELILNIAAGGDDGEWTDGSGNAFTSGNFQVNIGESVNGLYRQGFFRFIGGSELEGKRIDSAVVNFAVVDRAGNPQTVRVYGRMADNPTAPTSLLGARSAALVQNRTTAFVEYVEDDSIVAVSTPDIKTVIQEIADNHLMSAFLLMFLTQESGSVGYFAPASFEHTTIAPAQIVISYSEFIANTVKQSSQSVGVGISL